MTEDIDMIPDEMTAEQVAPMVLFLASDLADDLSGKIYGIHGRQLLEYKMLMTEGVTKEGADWTAAEIATKLDAIGAEQAPPAGAGAAAAAPMSDQQIIDKAFEMLPQVFLPGRAKGWTAAVVFDIQGGDPWTMVVKDGTCSTSKTKHDSPTCVVTVDKATYASVVKGELKPEKAFMAGKIKATNLADMMKFGSAFDMKKARALAEAEKAKANAGGSASAAAAPKTLTDAEIIDRAFELLPKVFVPGRAKGWTAAIVFDIQGASSWTVEIKDGTCKTVRSKSDSPTCVVTVDAETYAAVVKGKLKPEKAFMAGKIKATNLGDMMKFGSAFDMKKARQVAEEAKAAIKSGSGDGATASPAAAGPAALVATAFNALPKAFKPDAVSGWSAVLQFEIGGGDDWTVTIQDGTCTTEVGKHGTATCVIKTKLEDYARVVSGELKAEQAFMQGKISASNLGEMMKFGRAFDVKKAAELIRAAASGGGSGAVEESGLNRACLGKEFTGEEPLFVRPEQALAFAEATEDGNSVYRGGGEGVYAPPMFAVRMLKDVMFKAAGDPELKADLMNLVHGEQDMEFLRPLKTWDLCATRATITGIEDKSTGQLLRIEESVLTAGEEAVRVRASMFIRDPSKKKPKGETPKEAPTEAAAREITFSDTVTVAADQGPRYAEAGGDNNPIHTDDEIAKLAGFKGIILQGLCTMSFACKAVVDKLADGDPAKLKRIAVRFTKPVLMGETLTTEGWSLDPKDGRSVYGFRVVNQDGVEVITNGIAELVG
jgi:acyl dehydratase/putative sterol carrier protein